MTWITSWAGTAIHTVSIVCFLALAGRLLGRIRIGGVSLGMAGVLAVAVAYGAFFGRCPVWRLDETTLTFFDDSVRTQLSFLSSLGSAFFLSAVGVSAGRGAAVSSLRKKVCWASIGALMTAAGGVTAAAICLLDTSMSSSKGLGLLTGALTSTPGLAAIQELPSADAEAAVAGYGISYLFGVAAVVLLVQVWLRRNTNMPKPSASNPKPSPVQEGKATDAGLFHLLFVMLLGTALGALKLPFPQLSLGSSGGILIVGLLSGRSAPLRQIPSETLALFRTLGLTLFLIGTGLPAGIRFEENFRPKDACYGAAITLTALATGYLLSRHLSGRGWEQAACLVCGGMTSTPALGAVTDRLDGEPDLSAYTVAYTSAMLSLVLLVKVLFWLLS